jgi:hypothetical protein
MLILAEVIEVHVTNPPMGAELLLLGVGFIAGAVAWRMFMGRW